MISSVEILSEAFLALKEGGQKIVLSVNLYNRLQVCLTLNHPFLMSELKMNIKIIEFLEHFEAFLTYSAEMKDALINQTLMFKLLLCKINQQELRMYKHLQPQMYL